MGEVDDRITELEIALTHQQGYVEQLNTELIAALGEIDLLKLRTTRLERLLSTLLPEGDGLAAAFVTVTVPVWHRFS